MASIATIGYDETLFTVRAEWLYTYARLLKSPQAKAFAPDFATVGPVIDAAIKTQGGLDDDAVMAAAARDAADDALDPVVVQILATILLITKGDRTDPLYLSYASDLTASELVRPVLGQELAAASEWVEPLKIEPDASLQAYAGPLDDAVKEGAASEKAVKTAEKALSDFRLLGDRKKAVDTLNSARAILYGKLLQLHHDHPELRLGAAWASIFFRRATKTSKYGTTVDQIQAYIAGLDADRIQAVKALEEAKQKAAEHAQAKENRAKARAELAELRKNKKAQKAQEKALEAEANKKLKKK